jgi:hypothetical protein
LVGFFISLYLYIFILYSLQSLFESLDIDSSIPQPLLELLNNQISVWTEQLLLIHSSPYIHRHIVLIVLRRQLELSFEQVFQRFIELYSWNQSFGEWVKHFLEKVNVLF